MRLYYEMSSWVEVGCTVKGGSTMYCGVENDGTKAEIGKLLF